MVHCCPPVAFEPQFRLFLLNLFSLTPQNIVIELAIDELAPGDEFMVNNSVNVDENDEHALGHAEDLSSLLQLWRQVPIDYTHRPKSRPQ